jgi:hypothetical protein
MAMDQVGRDAAAQDMIDWVQCTANCEAVGSLTGILEGQEKKQVHQFIEACCGGQPADASLVTLLEEWHEPQGSSVSGGVAVMLLRHLTEGQACRQTTNGAATKRQNSRQIPISCLPG